MLKKFLIPGTLCAAVLLQSCDGYKKTDNGLQYKLLKDTAGRTAKEGDFVVFNFIFKNSKDSILRNTFKEGTPVSMPLMKPTYKGALEEGFTLLSKGDSAEFKVNADSLFAKTFQSPMPKEIEKGSEVTFLIKVVNVLTEAEMKQDYEKKMKEAEVQRGKQLGSDTTLIISALKDKNLEAKRTKNGVYYIVEKAGKGKQIEYGDSVQVYYTGKLMNGKQFDSNVGKQPFQVRVGMGQVIPGWEDLLAQLRRGDKVTAYIPSSLAYGPNQAGPDIAPNSILVFDIEILDNGSTASSKKENKK